MPKRILSIQSKLVYGYVGSNVAEMVIQLHGIDIISFPTVLLATHTGHKPVYGRAITIGLFEELIQGIEALNVIESTNCLITGYIGSEDILESSTKFIQKIKTQYPNKPYICDPVMGDMDRGLYIPEKVARKLMGDLVSQCDILTPNHFEVQQILGRPIDSIQDLKTSVSKSSLRDKVIVVTSCNLADTPDGVIETIVLNNQQVDRIHVPKVDISTTGNGDLFTAMLSAQLTVGRDVITAVKAASIAISDSLAYLYKHNQSELSAECLMSFVYPHVK